MLPYRGLETSPSFACLAASKLGAAVRWTAALTRITSLWMDRPRWAGHPPPFFAFEAKTQIFTHKPRRGDGVFHLCAGGVLHYAFCGRPPLYCRFRKERNTRAAVLAAGRVLTATPSRRDTGLSSGMTHTRPSYPASEKADSTDTPRPVSYTHLTLPTKA